MVIRERLREITQIIQEHSPLLIAYSGGIDSTLLAILARDIIGEHNMLCVLVDGPEVPERGRLQAIKQAEEHKFPLKIVQGTPFSDSLMQENPPDRCRYCKLGTFDLLKKEADSSGCRNIADGANISDLGEHRPGIEAFSSCGVIHPFIMAGISKTDIRAIAQDMNLPFWNKPSSACLYSRIPYGEEITEEKLRIIERGEDMLTDIGISQSRVRHHGSIARIEVLSDEMRLIMQERERVLSFFTDLGFSYVTLDLKGYRPGSMDEIL